MRQHIVGRQNIARLHFGIEYRRAITGIAGIQLDVFGHDALSYVPKNRAAHQSARSGDARLLYADDATIPRSIGRKVAGKA